MLGHFASLLLRYVPDYNLPDEEDENDESQEESEDIEYQQYR